MNKPEVGKVQSRDGIINAITGEVAEGGERIITVAFSSEVPVERYFGNEILSHDVGAVDLSRLNDGAPLLLNHETEEQIGVVESASIDSDRVGRAVVRFSRSSMATDIWNDVMDGIRRKVSVGYIVTEYTAGSIAGEFIATKWQPIEVSLVSIPADNSVGVGRNLEVNLKGIDVMQKEDVVDVVAIRELAAKEAREQEMARVGEINKIAQRHGLVEMAVDFVNSGKSASEFSSAALEEVSARAKKNQARSIPATQLDMGTSEVKKYSMLKAIRALASGDWKNAGLELEASIAIADKLGKESRGFFVPYEIQTRAQNVTTGSAGGVLVPVELQMSSFVEMLRAKSVVMGLGARTLNGVVGNVDIPKQTSASTAYWVAEDGAATDSQAAFANIRLSPKTLANAVPITRRMLEQTDGSFDSLITMDIANVMALALDLAILEGDGTNKPLGITGTVGVNTQTVTTAGSPSWAELVGFETAIDADNALVGNLAYVTTPSVKGNLKVTKKDAGSGIYLLDGGVANGYQVATTTQISANRIIFGNFADVVIANWGVLDIMKDTATKASSGGIVLRAFQDVDAAIRNAQSFCINA